MSIFNSASAPCPVCDTVKTLDLVASVNADRRPDLRDAIQNGTFQAETCDACGTSFKFPPQITYVDVGRNQWLMAIPPWRIVQWREAETVAQSAFAVSFGAQAPKIAQSIGDAMSPRLVFGWPALREKLLIDDLGLDDVALELLKITLIANVKNMVMAEQVDLRLVGRQDGQLQFAWLHAERESTIATLSVAQDLLDEIIGDPAPWATLGDDLADGCFVDLNRFLVPGTATPGAA